LARLRSRSCSGEGCVVGPVAMASGPCALDIEAVIAGCFAV
jgi:hypothetical protein